MMGMGEARLGRSQNSICAPSSTTRLDGIWKNSVAERALRDMSANSFFRQRAILACPVEDEPLAAEVVRRLHRRDANALLGGAARAPRGMFGDCMKPNVATMRKKP